MKTANAPGLSDVPLELIAANLEVVIQVIAEICHIVLGEFGIGSKHSGSNFHL